VLVVQGNGATPLHAVSENGHMEVLRALLDAGAAVNQADVSGAGDVVRRKCECVVVQWVSLRSLFVMPVSAVCFRLRVICVTCGDAVRWLDASAFCEHKLAQGGSAGSAGCWRGSGP
jgi:hypothetical protein